MFFVLFLFLPFPIIIPVLITLVRIQYTSVRQRVRHMNQEAIVHYQKAVASHVQLFIVTYFIMVKGKTDVLTAMYGSYKCFHVTVYGLVVVFRAHLV